LYFEVKILLVAMYPLNFSFNAFSRNPPRTGRKSAPVHVIVTVRCTRCLQIEFGKNKHELRTAEKRRSVVSYISSVFMQYLFGYLSNLSLYVWLIEILQGRVSHLSKKAFLLRKLG